ncbi:hypothetical protein [Paenibacillus sp. J2TS4]|uniref:hypothetical protein n=1 Tax=Paenibacillus sp. J2TS4 TaxID=2807194 RepID=UPI001B0460C4|nr:hypothetical protein [Paenibacillus sp. J2TS4]GIP34723.1 hypothetical protein J2TS4_39330 [Paenibacillus sp. J2TS4]
MNEQYQLTMTERDAILEQLSDEQRSFLADTLRRGRRTIFAQKMAAKKGARIPETATYEEIEHLLEDWIYIGYIDAGVRDPDLRCECGASLRYQHHVENKRDGRVLKLGIKHLEEHTLIDAKIVSQIVKGFDALDEEQFEVLIKFRDGWELSDYFSLPFPEGFTLSKDMASHLQVQLPLLDRQLVRLQESLRKFREDQPAAPAIPTAHARPLVESAAKPYQESPAVELEEDSQLSFDLFDMEQNSAFAVSPRTAASQAYDAAIPELPARLQGAIRGHLLQGVRSTRILCEILIQHHGAEDARYITDKPYIFPLVAMHIDRNLVQEGICRLVSKDHEDRIYELTGSDGPS